MECYAAWVPLSGDYPKDRRRVMRLLAGRTNCRDFGPSPGDWWSVPKSSLDGARESVLWKVGEGSARTRQARLRLAAGEQLDVVGVVKRLAQPSQRYPSVSRIAADPWLRGAAARAPEEFGRLAAVCEKLAEQRVVTRIDVGQYQQFREFPFEGSVVYPNRFRELAEESACDDGSQLEELRGVLHAVVKKLRSGEPNAYLAVLAADGDNLTKVLDHVNSPERHRQFSRQVSRFAAEASQTIADHHGVAVYAGGDDILAFLPVHRAVSCAHRLRDDFAATTGRLLEEWSVRVAPTLSVGIAIGHFLEAMEDLLGWGLKAERIAKGPSRRGNDDRDGLAILLQSRGGAPLVLRRPWSTAPEQDLQDWADLLLSPDQLPDKVAYDLRQLGRVYRDWPAATRKAALQSDARRLLRGKGRGSAAPAQGLARIDRRLESVEDDRDLDDLTAEILIARRIAAAARQEGAAR